MAPTTVGWRKYKALAQAAFPCRFVIGTWLILVAALLFPAQSHEALLVTAEEWWKAIGLVAATTAWAPSSWYFSRVMLRLLYPGYLEFDEKSQERRWSEAAATWLPRALGADGNGAATWWMVGTSTTSGAATHSTCHALPADNPPIVIIIKFGDPPEQGSTPQVLRWGVRSGRAGRRRPQCAHGAREGMPRSLLKFA